jgi:serine protease inhibitor
MLNEKVYGFYKDNDLKATAIELPYKGKELAMLIILPDADFGYEVCCCLRLLARA